MVQSYIILSLTALLSVIASAVFYRLEKNPAFYNFSYKKKQLIYGVVFGILSVLGTELGMPVKGVVLNVRDVAPICAGLIFGAPAGIISGFIGGIERYFAVYWGAGTYTRLACTLATIFAGLISAFLRKYMFENKKPAWFFGLMIGAITEVFHMMVVFLIHINEPREAFMVVQACTIPMIILTATGAGLAILVVSLMGDEKVQTDQAHVKISHDFQRQLLICVLAAFIMTSIFTYVFVSNVSLSETDNLLTINLGDVEKDILEASDSFHRDIASVVPIASHNRHIGEEGFIIIFDENMNIIGDYSGKLSEEKDMFLEASNQYEEKQSFHISIENEKYICMYLSVEGYLVYALRPLAETIFVRDMSVYLTLFMEVMVFTVLFIAVYILIRVMIVDNISKVNQYLGKITGGNLEVVVDVRSNQEFTSLSDDINSTVSTLKDYIAQAAARIDQELEYAREIQYSSLPHVFPPFPDRHEFEIWAGMNTAKEVGGDFYDFYFVSDTKLAFLIADVSGKGIPAALFMMRAKTMLKNMASTGMSVEDVFTQVNNSLCENNEADMFVTAWMGVLDITTGLVRFANAGHNPPIIKKGNSPFDYHIAKKSLVLGGMEGIKYGVNEVRLNPGDVIFLYTDGVSEATNSNNELYGDERLKNCINSLPDPSSMSPMDICHGIKAGVDEFVGDAPQFDDITMLCLRFIG